MVAAGEEEKDGLYALRPRFTRLMPEQKRPFTLRLAAPLDYCPNYYLCLY